MRPFGLIFWVSTLALAPLAAQAQQASGTCGWSRITLCNDCTQDRYVTVSAGGTCLIETEIPGKFIGIDFPVRPKLGRVGVANNFTVAYQTQNATADDYFEYLVRFEGAGVSQRMTVRTHVKISPAAR